MFQNKYFNKHTMVKNNIYYVWFIINNLNNNPTEHIVSQTAQSSNKIFPRGLRTGR